MIQNQKGKYFFTSESVTEGHPDKVADLVSDSVLDAILTQEPDARVACETLVTTGMVIIAGEVTTAAHPDLPQIVRNAIREIGYTSSAMGFDCNTCAILSSLDRQSPDIAMGVDRSRPDEQGAGDQGMMFGFACRETEALMPAPIYWAHKLARRLAQVRKEGLLNYLRPDGKTEITFEYHDGKPCRIDTIVVASQHSEEISTEVLREAIHNEVILHTLPAEYMDKQTRVFINATGRFVIGGPMGDTGLTGRKIIQDTYGGMGGHGGGAFSGKDPSKVDRSGAYMARYIAKNVVAAGLADTCEVQIAYVIGIAEPISVLVTSFGTSELPDEKLTAAVKEVFDMRPYHIIKRLNLKRPIYKQATAYGHFGRDDLDLPWERTDAVEDLRKAAGR